MEGEKVKAFQLALSGSLAQFCNVQSTRYMYASVTERNKPPPPRTHPYTYVNPSAAVKYVRTYVRTPKHIAVENENARKNIRDGKRFVHPSVKTFEQHLPFSRVHFDG